MMGDGRYKSTCNAKGMELPKCEKVDVDSPGTFSGHIGSKMRAKDLVGGCKGCKQGAVVNEVARDR